MNRHQMIEVVKELLEVLNRKKITPNEASSIGEIFKESIEECNNRGVQDFMSTGEFHGGPPKA